jgi:hypothetical protein
MERLFAAGLLWIVTLLFINLLSVATRTEGWPWTDTCQIAASAYLLAWLIHA